MPMPASETKRLSAFGDRAGPPTAAELKRTLGSAAAAWVALIRQIRSTYPPATEQWSFAGAKFGWSLRLKKSDRVILYLIPQAGRFLAGIVLGERAVVASKSADLPASVLRAIAESPRYAEGTGLRLPVEDGSQLPALVKLVALKMAKS